MNEKTVDLIIENNSKHNLLDKEDYEKCNINKIYITFCGCLIPY
jgi:hypothetical protein